MSALGQLAGEAMVEWWALRAGSRLLLMPKAEAMELAPKQSAEADDPLASRSEGFVLTAEIALVQLRRRGLSAGRPAFA